MKLGKHKIKENELEMFFVKYFKKTPTLRDIIL